MNRLPILTGLSALFLLFTTACRVTFAPPVPTEAPTPAPTATATPIWFPPTATPTPFTGGNLAPTPDMRPGIGELLLVDDLSQADPWTTASDANGVAAVSEGTLHLTLREERSYMFSLRTAPVFTDFYAEITANPSLCDGQDEYGFVVRAKDGDHYRLALTCDGHAKAERYQGGSLSRQAGWVQDLAIPSLAPSSSRLAVWASGEQMHFFVNDFYLFSIRDTQLYFGTLGVFVHAAGEGDVSVSFDDLQVWTLGD
ncbi:MAG: hypothetical protein WD751_08155 [Anaerolineales bacterium]